MKIAAIDIGSNAIRFQVTSVLERKDRILFKKLEYVRFPLRLGHDVFGSDRISKQSIAKFKKLMKTYKLLLELYEVDDYMFCATSAMRESKNGPDLVRAVKREIGIDIHIIDGQLEAELINRAISSFLDKKSYLHIDVGGGSTELNLFAKGKKIKTKSFRVGSVRVLEHHDSPIVWEEMENWVKDSITERKGLGQVIAVGTGGNASKLYELSQTKAGKAMSLKKMKQTRAMIDARSMEERIYEMQMNPDRADVIIPASNIYIQVMEWAKSDKMMVPEVGLKDGILLHLFEKNRTRKKVEFVNAEDQSQGKKITMVK
jgi:exopolyphosphatase / guanosine-5'-triphosphate,3'-diphosphate pyrophosphatase